mgnify:CR=1 FL=1
MALENVRMLVPVSALALLVTIAGCSGPYQAPLAKRSINRERDVQEARVDRGATEESDLVVQEPPIRAAVIAPADAPTARTSPTDAIATAQFRERALGILTAAASGEDSEQRANAIEALIPTPARLKPLLGPALADQNPGVRGIAAMAVGRARITDLAPLVGPLLSDPVPQVRANAIYALVRCGQDVDPTPLGEMLYDPSPLARAQAAYVLGELGEQSAIGPLRDAQRKGMPRAAPGAVRMMELQMAEARTKLGDDDALIDIRTALFPARNEDLEATALAAQIVGQVGDQAAIDRLMYLTAEWDRDRQPLPAEIRLTAAGSLAKLGHRQGSFIALQYCKNPRDVLRAQAAHVLGETGWQENLPTLTPMLDDPSGRVRVAAASAVAKITGASALPGQ